MGERDRMALHAAQRYYVHQVPTPKLAQEMAVSRSTISRLIAHARAMGWVHIEVRGPFGLRSAVEQRIQRHFGLAHLSSVPTTNPLDTLVAAARAAATFLNGLMSDGTTLAVAWGTTTEAITAAIRPRPLVGATVVQLNGAGTVNDASGTFGSDIISNLARVWGATGDIFPVPTFFDHAETRELLWKERSIRRILSIQAKADLALFSVGAVGADVPSQVHVGGYLSPAELGRLHRAGVVGDIATVFYRADGTTTGIELNSRASGPPLDDLRRIPNRLCVAVGGGKAAALAAALEGGYITHLLADQRLLSGVARIMDSTSS